MTTSSSSAESDAAALQLRIAELEAENERLSAVAGEAPDTVPEGRRRGAWRPFVSAVCIVLASILVPVSIVGAWTRAELVDPDRFVATFGPLIEEPEVQELVIDQASAAIQEQVDIEGITNDLFDGIAGLDLPPRALAALDLLRVPAAQGAQSIIDQTVTRVVESDAFADVWDGALRGSHRALVVAATGGNDGGAVTIDDSGVIGIELGPIIAEVRERLIERGVGFASAIPAVDRTIVVAQSDALVTVRLVYGIAVTVGWWLPVIALLLFIAGVFVARRRTTAILGAGIGLALGGATLAIGLAVGQSVLGFAASDAGVPGGALAVISDQVIGAMRQTAIVVTVVGIVVALLAWAQGRWRGAVALRSAVGGVNDSIRGVVSSRGVDTGAFGVWMDRQRVLVRVLLAVLAVLWLWLLRPLGVGEIFMVVIVALIVWWLCELVRRPAEDTPALDADDSVDAEELERVG